MNRKLSKLQEKYVELYNGDSYQTMREVYKDQNKTDEYIRLQAHLYDKNQNVRKAILEKSFIKPCKSIMDKISLQSWWSKIVIDEKNEYGLQDKIKVSDLLAKSLGIYHQVVEHQHTIELADSIAQARKRLLTMQDVDIIDASFTYPQVDSNHTSINDLDDNSILTDSNNTYAICLEDN